MTSVAERLDIADRLRGISLANSRRVDVEADAPDRAVVTDGWIRKWDQQKGEYFWENPKMSVITHENPLPQFPVQWLISGSRCSMRRSKRTTT